MFHRVENGTEFLAPSRAELACLGGAGLAGLVGAYVFFLGDCDLHTRLLISRGIIMPEKLLG